MVSETLITVAELAIDGITHGVVLALLGLGITIVFGLGGVLNLAIGMFSVIAVIVAFELHGIVYSLPIAIFGAVAVVGLLGLTIDRTLLSLVYRSEGEERIVLGIFVTLGLAIFVQGLMTLEFPSSYSLPMSVPSTTLLGVQIRGSSIAIIGISAVIFAVLYYFFSRTYLGSATRTVMQDETGAMLCGISPRRMRTLVFVLSLLIAAVAGVLYGFTRGITVSSGFELTIQAVIVSIVGGVTSIVGAVVAGLLLGVVVTYMDSFVGTYVAEISLFAIAIGVLLVRPERVA